MCCVTEDKMWLNTLLPLQSRYISLKVLTASHRTANEIKFVFSFCFIGITFWWHVRNEDKRYLFFPLQHWWKLREKAYVFQYVQNQNYKPPKHSLLQRVSTTHQSKLNFLSVFVLLVLCFAIWKSHHHAIKTIHERKCNTLKLYFFRWLKSQIHNNWTSLRRKYFKIRNIY